MNGSATVEIDGQYRQLREEAGLLERPSERLIAVTGSEGDEYLQGQLTNDIEALERGGGCYAALLDRKGKMETDARVLRSGPDEILFICDISAAPTALKHLQTYSVGRDAAIAGAPTRGIVSLIGPSSDGIVAKLAGEPAVPGPAENLNTACTIAGVAALAVRTAAGIDLIAVREEHPALIAALTGAGAAAVTEAATEIVRIEAGRPRFGAEMLPGTMPAEAGIVEQAVSFTKGCYIGQETVARLHYKGRPNRVLRGLRLSEAAESGSALLLGEKEVGVIGSTCLSPTLGRIGLAIVRREAEEGDELVVKGSAALATIVELAFRGER